MWIGDIIAPPQLGIFSTPNEYGWCVNVNHNEIANREYFDFKKQRGIPRESPLSEDERGEFEMNMRLKYFDAFRATFLGLEGDEYEDTD